MVVIAADVAVWLSAFMSAQHTPAIQPINAKLFSAQVRKRDKGKIPPRLLRIRQRQWVEVHEVNLVNIATIRSDGIAVELAFLNKSPAMSRHDTHGAPSQPGDFSGVLPRAIVGYAMVSQGPKKRR